VFLTQGDLEADYLKFLANVQKAAKENPVDVGSIFNKVGRNYFKRLGSYCQSGMVPYYLWKLPGFIYFLILP
jgi:hypothetical protein